MNTDKLKKHNQVHRAVTQADIDGNEAIGADNLKVGDMAWFEVDKLKEAAEAAIEKYHRVYDKTEATDLKIMFIAGAQWQEQQDRLSIIKGIETYVNSLLSWQDVDLRKILEIIKVPTK